ncbi:MAG: NAD(P)-dependent oxidoreductase [Candidatus Levyibacteriota bacterium]
MKENTGNSNITVGFIGLGIMGVPMATNILKKGFRVAVYNRTATKAFPLKKLGATIVSSPKEIANVSTVVITMVTGPKEVQEILFGKNGVSSSHKKPIVIDMSTIGPTAAREINKKLQKFNIAFLDAPVTGSLPKAITGELTIFVGGEKHVFEKVKDILMCMGKPLYIGESGEGQAIKMINNQLVAETIVAVAEGMLLADAMKLPREKVVQFLSDVPAVSPFMKLKMPNYATHTYPLLFSMKNMNKDLLLARKEVQKAKKQLRMLPYVSNLHQKAMKKGLGNEDFSAIIKLLE